MTDGAWGLPLDVDSTEWDRMADITPKSYVCHYAAEPPQIDGKLDDEAWSDAPWSEPFVDIEGDRRPAPAYETRMAMRWDDEHLYIAARLEEPHVWGTLTERNSVIFRDNDFEVFIDPDGDNHNYYEFEINALNTIWELSLVKPYRDGGPPISPANIDGLRSAVYVEGTLNAPHDRDDFWSLEIAIPWSGLAPYGETPPADGATWRMNFSRVQWQHEIVGTAYRKVPDTPEDNWVWTPQGVVDMHRPERWGFVQFTRSLPGARPGVRPGEPSGDVAGDRPGEAAFRPDPTLPARDALMALYYAQKAFFNEHGRWARSLDELGTSPDPGIDLRIGDEGWTATLALPTPAGERILQVNHLSRLIVVP